MLISECRLELSNPSEFSIGEYNANLNLGKVNLDVEHIKCVVSAIAIAIGDSELASTWIKYHVELKDSILRLVACKQYDNINKKMYV